MSEAMRNCGFVTKYGNDTITAKYGALFFDDDSDSRRMGCATPQIYLMKLGSIDPLLTVPDAAGIYEAVCIECYSRFVWLSLTIYPSSFVLYVVFVARTSWMFRAMGSLLDEQIQTAKRWSKYAIEALAAAS